MQSAPKPETTTIVAVCAPLLATGRKIPPQMWTAHDYVRTVRRADARFGELRPEFQHWFRCRVTGTERVLGLAGDSTPLPLEETNDAE